MPKLRSLIVEAPTSIGAKARARRWAQLVSTFPGIADYDVLDLGGTPESWLRAPVQPRSVTLLNLFDHQLTLGTADGEQLPDWITVVAGDACDPPPGIRSGSYDLVYSNSLIEHVGGPANRERLALFARAAAPRLWVQTPYRYFPIEPHWIFPGFQFLPLPTRARLSRSWPLLHTRSPNWDHAVQTALSVELLGLTEMRYLFPGSEIRRERMAGLTKSITAVRTH